jgi:hypothetical protein
MMEEYTKGSGYIIWHVDRVNLLIREEIPTMAIGTTAKHLVMEYILM